MYSKINSREKELIHRQQQQQQQKQNTYTTTDIINSTNRANSFDSIGDNYNDLSLLDYNGNNAQTQFLINGFKVDFILPKIKKNVVQASNDANKGTNETFEYKVKMDDSLNRRVNHFHAESENKENFSEPEKANRRIDEIYNLINSTNEQLKQQQQNVVMTKSSQQQQQQQTLNQLQMSKLPKLESTLLMHQNNNFKPKALFKSSSSLEPFSFKLPLNELNKIDESHFADSVKTGSFTSLKTSSTELKSLNKPNKLTYSQSFMNDDYLRDKRFRKKVYNFNSETAPKKNNSKIEENININEMMNSIYEHTFDNFSKQSNLPNLQSLNNLQTLNPAQLEGKRLRPEIGRARLKCKSPINYSTDKKIRDIKTPVQGRWSPIKIQPSKSHKLFERLRSDDEQKEKQKELKELFKKLDSDDDGHVGFDTLHSHFAQNFNEHQKTFFRQIYESFSESTFFGFREFFIFALLVDQFKKLKSEKIESYWESFVSSDFEDYKKEINEFLKFIETLDFSKEIKTVDVVKMRLKNLEFDEKHAKLLNASLQEAKNSKLNIQLNGDCASVKILSFILLIPLFILIDSSVRNLPIFKRHHNSILHMKEVSNFHNFNRRIV